VASTITAKTATSVELPVSGLWVIAVQGDELAGDVPVVTVTRPDATTDVPTVAVDGCGWYRAEYIVAAPGRHIARAVTTGHGAVDFTAFVTGVVTAADMPTIVDVAEYLEDHSWTDDQLADALDAETNAQRRVCDVPAAYPPDLRQALLRRCWRNLIMRGQPALTVPGAEDGSLSVVPTLDQEIRRFERPFRKLVGR
jgi:hypothetical protein